MARDEGLEEMMRGYLREEPELAEKTMFGGRVWLLNGNLLSGARDDGALIRLGKGNDAWALEIDGIVPMRSGERKMAGWVRVASLAFDDNEVARKLIDAALAFVRSLPPK